ncbi:hypothetical protein NLM16_30400, partial [Bradyrhizobium brasilense]|uniref:hypothetical protein n=1 Tax=Bradyrhizobium brasilense TaxID=1419277 RepID=UPI00287801FD
MVSALAPIAEVNSPADVRFAPILLQKSAARDGLFGHLAKDDRLWFAGPDALYATLRGVHR